MKKKASLLTVAIISSLIIVLTLSPVLGAGSGVFIDSGQRLGSSNSFGIALADLDSDGDLDAFVTNTVNHPNRVWVNDGTGNFVDSGQSLGNADSYGLALGDVDGDGDLDAFVGNITRQPSKVLLNDGTGTFVDSGQNLGSSYSYGVALGDLDNDDDLDAFVANANHEPNKVWLNDGTGTFVDSGQNMGNDLSVSVSLGDLDADGDLDAFVANQNTGNEVWLNNGSAIFSNTGQRLGSANSFDVALGDVEGDGDLDAFVANSTPGGQPDKVWLNDGNGNFTDSGQELGNSNSQGVALGDLDDDGDLDAFVGNIGTEPNEVWLNDGSGSFTDSGQRLGISYTQRVALGDVDGDSDLDVFVANWVGQANEVFLNEDQQLVNHPPDCSNARPSQDTLWPPSHKFVAIHILGITDSDGDSVVPTIDSIFQDEPVDVPDSENTSPDGQGLGTTTAEVRAERVDSGNGRVYHIYFTADDGHGGKCSGEILVGVPKSQGQAAGPIDDGPLHNSTEPQ